VTKSLARHINLESLGACIELGHEYTMYIIHQNHHILWTKLLTNGLINSYFLQLLWFEILQINTIYRWFKNILTS
jgi:hypothetical protein